eukprot:jgi/Tetstr1/456547/TSEL_043269.t1
MTREDESSLAKCVLNWADRGLALSKRTVKKHALDIIKSRGYDKDRVTKIWIKRGKMSRKWFRGFMRRHPELHWWDKLDLSNTILRDAELTTQKNAWMDGDLYHYWVETVFLPYTEELRRRGKILLIIDSFSDSEEGEDEIEEKEKEDGEQGEDELNLAYIDEDGEWLNW